MSGEKLMQSKPMFTTKALVSLTVPIIISLVISMSTGLVDSIMLSSVGETAVSAASLIDSIISVILIIFGAIATGGVVVCAQYMGAQNYERATVSAKQLIYVAGICGFAFMAIFLTCIPQTVSLIYGAVEPQVFNDCKTYFFWSLFGMPGFALGSATTALLNAQQKSKTALIISAAVNIINIFGNAILIYGLKLGVAGAAISTSFIRVLYGVFGSIAVCNKKLPIKITKLAKIKFDFDVLKRIFGIGITNGIENGLSQCGKVIIASMVSGLGTVAIAANSVATSIISIGWTALGAMNTVLLTVVGQCIGAGEKEQARNYTKKLTNTATLFMIFMFALVFIFRNQLVLMFDFEAETLRECARLTALGALITIIPLYSWATVPFAAFRAAGDTKFPMYVAILCIFIVQVGGSYILREPLGIYGIWLAMGACYVVRTICNLIHFKRGKWLDKKVI